MTGDGTDIFARLRSLLPSGWFPNSALALLASPDDTPILTDPDGSPLLSGLSGPPVLAAVLQAPSTALAFVYALLAYVKLQTRIATASGGNLDLIAYDFFGTSFTRAAGQSDASFAAAIVAQIFLARNTRPAIVSVLTALTGTAPVVVEPWRLPDCGALNVTAFRGAVGVRGSRNLPFTVFVTATLGSGATAAEVYAAVESVRPAGVTCWVRVVS
ncbi:MAG: hypothetical protein ACREEW_15455 [Caulobacteraceae bacterium]